MTDEELVQKKLAFIIDIVENHLGDIDAFVAAVRARLIV